jgi:uncharacterized protein (TIGR00369 family)
MILLVPWVITCGIIIPLSLHTVKIRKIMDKNHYRKLEDMYHSAPCNEYYSPKLTVSKGKAEIVIPIRKDFFHAAGATHGSVYFKALDDAAFFSVNSLVKDVFVLTSNFNIYLIRPITSGEMKAVGTVVSVTRSQFIAEAVLFDSKGREIARGSGCIASKMNLLS